MRNPISAEAFADWCDKQVEKGNLEYHYSSNTDCAFAQYLRSLGIEAYVRSNSYVVIGDEDTFHFIPREIVQALYEAFPVGTASISADPWLGFRCKFATLAKKLRAAAKLF